MSKGDVFKSFYADLEELQAYHKKFPGLVERPVGLCVVPSDVDCRGASQSGRFVQW